MTTCRLLCALLVLALCCCPSVCVMATVVAEEDGPSDPESPPEEPGRRANSLISNALTFPEAGTSGVQDKTHKAAAGQGSGVSSTEQTKRGSAPGHSGSVGGENNPVGSTGNSVKSVVKSPEQDKEVLGPNEEAKIQIPNTTTTTTTTHAPNSTTTTTTTAPEAPIDAVIDTETPITTTSRAPSRLREIDGSLSSFAWVCAPLLLAASALACTAVG
uniref:Mucin-like protein n=1 Tax=Trypanosoma cruzi TaxID=5693 RepID=Q26880_TRYCR|nr:mucin-like protein [Trypanosoma cruzi]prf//2124391D mucin-like protein [Trypanosoma cruzi]